MSVTEEALETLKGFQSLLLEGKTMRSDIAKVLQGATIERTIDGASTLTLELYDDARTLLQSGVFSERTTMQLDNFNFELVQVRKTGPALSITLEDLPVAALRRRDRPIKVAPNTTTHVDFAERLVKEEPWLNFWVPPGLRSGERAKVELARGEPAAEEKKEDSWTALGRIADERGWRRYVLNKDTIAYVPETFLIGQPAAFTIIEGADGVENIDFDFDSGKPVATVKVVVRVARWALPVGTAVAIEDLGPVNGRWIVSSTSRSLFSIFLDVTLTRARPVLPEPKPGDSSSSSSSSTSTTSSSNSFSPGAYSPSIRSVEGRVSWPDDPTNLVSIGQGNHRLAEAAAKSFSLVERSFGRKIVVSDSYRSQATANRQGRENPGRFAVDSAHSEGRAVDVDLRAIGANPQGEPPNWTNDAVYRSLVDAFTSNGWCNYQLKAGTAKGRTREPWHFSYLVCK